ncbi:MAG: EthD family reductase [Pseudonocardia sp.]
MIKVSVYYPNSDGATFDMDYYVATHMPLVHDRCSPAIRGMSVDGGLAGGAPGAPAPFAAVGHLLFDSVEDFQSAFGPHSDEIMGDIPNYTKIEPMIQISEVKL